MNENKGLSYEEMVRGATCSHAHDPGLTSIESVGPTGGARPDEKRKLVTRQIGDFEISIIVDDRGQFVDVADIRLKRDFLTVPQRIAGTGYIDVEEFYRE